MTSPGNWQRRLQGYAGMSAKSLCVLNYLAASMAQGWPFVKLDDVHPNTIWALFEADLIAESAGDDGYRYKITARGERTRLAYSKPCRRNDGLCPRCGVRPRHVTQSGRVEGYCLVCANVSKRRAYKLRRPHHNPDRMCSHCHKRKVHISASGWVSTYCSPCEILRKRKRKRKKQNNRRNMQHVLAAKVEVQA